MAEVHPVRTARRRRAILLGARKESAAIHSEFASLATEFQASLHVGYTAAELAQLAEDPRDAFCLIVAEASFPEVLACMRSAHQTFPDSELVLLSPHHEQSALLKGFGPAPRLGTHWQLLDPHASTFARSVRMAFRRGDQRWATRTTLDRFNARLSAPETAVAPGELRKLVISDRVLSSVLESAFDAVLLIDSSGIVASFNPSAERLFQLKEAEALSRSAAGLAAGRWPQAVAACLKKAHGLIQTSIDLGSEVRQVEIAVTPVLDATKNRIATSLVVRDITERLLSEQALRTSEKLAAVGRLASSIAHEINNPLESVTNLLYLARASNDPVEIHEYLDVAERELRRVSVISSQTLRFHKQSTNPVRVRISELLDEVLAIHQGRLINSHVDVKLQCDSGSEIECFDGEIRQVLSNLVGNAADAMHPVGGVLIIRCRKTTHPKNAKVGLVVTVADSGPGMPHAVRRRIFDAFFTTKGIAGTGLGLWVSKDIIGRHQGDLSVRSSQRKEQSGTIFRMFLPFDGVARSLPATR